MATAAQGGDRAALDLLLRRHYDRVSAVCRRIVGNDADAADATQEALIAIVRGLPRFDHRAAFSTWAYRIATNASLDELRRRKRRPLPASDDTVPASQGMDPDAHHQVERYADRALLDAALATLPAEFRVPVVMRDVADLDYAEIAEVLSIPVGTVKSRIARGRGLLAQRLGVERGNHDTDSRRPIEEP